MVTREQIHDVVRRYDVELAERGYLVGRADMALSPSSVGGLKHVRWMIAEILQLYEERSVEKDQRWLGFIQGVLWSYGVETIDDMKGHNR